MSAGIGVGRSGESRRSADGSVATGSVVLVARDCWVLVDAKAPVVVSVVAPQAAAPSSRANDDAAREQRETDILSDLPRMEAIRLEVLEVPLPTRTHLQ